MAEGSERPVDSPDQDDDEVTPGYVPPKQVDLKTLQDLDADDEALVKYKQTLLGQTANVQDVGGKNVLVQAMVIEMEGGARKVELDLTGDLSSFTNDDKIVVIKEGTSYRVVIKFRVQREIVSGLRYAYSVHRKGIRVDKGNLMVGSYGPKTEQHVFNTPMEDAPSGLIQRGTYNIKSNFTDDDKNSILQWEWKLSVKKDWA